MVLFVDKQFASPYAMSAFVGLKEKGLAFDIKTVDLEGGENQEEVYAERSLTQRVPTLVHENFCLSESSAITEYLEDVFSGTPLYPKNPKEKARARQVQAWLRSDLLPIRLERTTEVIFYGSNCTPLSATAKAAAAKLFKASIALLNHGGENLFSTWSIADVDLALMLNRLVMSADVVPPQLAAYAARQWDRPALQEWVEMDRPPLKNV